MVLNVLKVFGLASIAFFLAIFLTPILTHYLYKYQMWKKKPRLVNSYGAASLESDKETHTPRMGGILIWFSTLAVISLFWFLSRIFPSELTEKMDFLSRSQTWLPLFTLISASLIGLVDDCITIFSHNGIGLSLKKRLVLVACIGAIGAWWFYAKLGMNAIDIPFVGEFSLGWAFIPVFIITMIAMFSGGVIDGIDGLSGGIFAAIFSAYGGIAFFRGQVDLAAFCAVIVGGILAFLWFNIPPARFYMGETGILGLTTVITVVAFITRSVVVLPIIAFLPLVAAGSNIIQLFSKKYRGKKVFLVAPIHHHFEALGWPSYKVTMRFWVISSVLAVVGMVIALAG